MLVARLNKVPAGASAPISQQPAILWGTGSFRAGARTRLWLGAGHTVHTQSEKRQHKVMEKHAVDMDRYPSVVLIEAFDMGMPDAFEKDLLQVGLSKPLFRSE